MSSGRNLTTLYVGNLNHAVTEDLLIALFSQIAEVKRCRIIREHGNDPYAFLEFTTHFGAATVRAAMNRRLFLEKVMKVNWASTIGNTSRTDIRNHHHIFVGDLSPEVDTQTLFETFSVFGEISNARIVWDSITLRPKGYAFVSFINKDEAENAINAMNEQFIGSQRVRTNWSISTPPPSADYNQKPSYDDISNRTSATNSTIYCGGLLQGMSHEIIEEVFLPFGTIADIRCFPDRGYAFIRFTTKEAAIHAIRAIHNTEITCQVVKCSWAKENGNLDWNNQNYTIDNWNAASGSQSYYMNGNMGYVSSGVSWVASPQTYVAPPPLQQAFMQGFHCGQNNNLVLINPEMGMPMNTGMMPMAMAEDGEQRTTNNTPRNNNNL